MHHFWKTKPWLTLSDADLHEHALAEARLQTTARLCIMKHALPVVLIGFGAASLEMRFKAAVHAFRLQTCSHEGLALFIQEIATHMNDYGTEKGVARLKPLRVAELCRHFCDTTDEDITLLMNGVGLGRKPRDAGAADGAGSDSDLDDVPHHVESENEIFEDAAARDEASEAPSDDDCMFERLPLPGVAAPMFSVDHWLEVPPLHHINDTATKGLGAVMPSYDDAVQGASQVCKIIRSRAHQPKLLERCFAGPINMQYHRRLKQFRGSIHTGRWATVAFAVPELLGIATIFRWGWNKQKFASGDVNARDQGREDTQNLVNGVDAFACSAFKWAFLVVLEALCVFLRRVTQFADSCPCHWHLFRSGAVPPELFKLMEKQWLQCPFRGMMTAELSHTDFFDMLQGLVSTSTA